MHSHDPALEQDIARRLRRRHRRDAAGALLYILPAAAIVLIFRLVPILAAFTFSFYEIKMGALVGFIVGALAKNWAPFRDHVSSVVMVVAIHNAVALGAGWLTARLGGLGPRDRRTVAIETGIQNSGLGLVLIFSFFNGLGGMAIIAAWWGVWHLVGGLSLASLWSRWPVSDK